MESPPIVLLTNDDGYRARGLHELIGMCKPLGRVVVVAPEKGNSGMSHAITIEQPLRLRRHKEYADVEVYSVNGTPVDCVKLAMNQLFSAPPALLVSGINHGSNSSVSIFYSGTMAASIEGCLYGIPSIGISLLDHRPDADFSGVTRYCPRIIQAVLAAGLPPKTCLNVNVPAIGADRIQGVRVCRQNMGAWREEFDKRVDPRGLSYYWLTGKFENSEPEAVDTDEHALRHGYISVVPVGIDLTNHTALPAIQAML